MFSKINFYILFLLWSSLNITSAARIDILKAFPNENLTGANIKTFRIPGSVIISATQQERAKRTTETPPVTIVVPIHVADDDDDDNEVDDDPTQPIEDADEGATEDVVSDEVIPEVEDETTTSPSQNVTGQTVRFPCQCAEGQCGCCTGVLLEQRLKMKACGNMSFVPEEFVFDVKFSVNNNTVVHRRVSASDPPPICFNPRRAPFVEVCAEISNIHIVDRNAHACLDIDANIGGFSVYNAAFNCFSLGSHGVQTNLKPQKIKKPADAPPTSNLFGNNEDDDDDDDDDDDGVLFGGGDGDGGGILGGDSDGGGIFGGGEGGGEGIFGGGDEDGGGGLFGGGDDDDSPDFGGAFDGAGGLFDY